MRSPPSRRCPVSVPLLSCSARAELDRAIQLTVSNASSPTRRTSTRRSRPGCQVLVLGGGDQRDLDGGSISERRGRPRADRPAEGQTARLVPADPGLARELAFIICCESGGRLGDETDHQLPVGAVGVRNRASAADLDRGDTVYCLAPLHHSSSLLASHRWGRWPVAPGSRSHADVDPERFAEEVHRYGVTVVSYTWTMMREILDAEIFASTAATRSGSSSDPECLQGLWRRTTERFAPAKVLEFYASTEGDVVLANVAGAKVGSKGTPVPGERGGPARGLRPDQPADSSEDEQRIHPGMRRTTKSVCSSAGRASRRDLRRRDAGDFPRVTPGFRRRTSSVATPTGTTGWSTTGTPSSRLRGEPCSPSRSSMRSCPSIASISLLPTGWRSEAGHWPWPRSPSAKGGRRGWRKSPTPSRCFLPRCDPTSSRWWRTSRWVPRTVRTPRR